VACRYGEDELDAFPLSPAQLRMWRADRLRPGNPVFNGSFRWNLVGPLDTDVFERAFNEIVNRHDTLRTKIACADGVPLQLIMDSVKLHIASTDLRSIQEAARDDEMDRICAEEARRGFNLEKGPLIRVGLLRMTDERNVVMLTVHHIVSDGWSIGIIMEELQQIYTAFASGHPSPLTKLPIQFGDYVVWQNQRIAEGGLASQLSYWKEKLADWHPLRVRGDFSRPAGYTTDSSIVSVLIEPKVTDALKLLSNELGGTMFTTTLSACMMLLHRYTNESDLSVGTTLAGRDRPEIENLVGIFINQVMLRIKISGDPEFKVFSTLVRDTVWEALANQELPFEEVVNALGNGEAESAIFHSINFICQREYARAATFVFEFAGLRMSTLPSKSQGALYDLNFFLVEREAGWRLSLEYRTDLYQEALAKRLIEDFYDLLIQITYNPTRTLSEFQLKRFRL